MSVLLIRRESNEAGEVIGEPDPNVRFPEVTRYRRKYLLSASPPRITYILHELVIHTVRFCRAVHLRQWRTRLTFLFDLDRVPETGIQGLLPRCHAGWFQFLRDRHLARLKITKHVPCHRQLLEARIRHTRYEAAELFQDIETGQVGIWEGGLGGPSHDLAAA